MYFYILWGRVIIDLVATLKRDWKPKGFVLAISVFLFKLTDPPVKFLRRFIKPLRLGQITLDLSVLLLFIALIVLMNAASLFVMA